MRLFILMLFAVCATINTHAQKQWNYKKADFVKVVDPEKARYRKVETLSEDTITHKYYRLQDELLLAQKNWVNKTPVSLWLKFDEYGKLISKRNFNEITYSNEPILEAYENETIGETCKTCEKASFPGGESEMFKYLGAELKFPSEYDRTKSGILYVRFIVLKNGELLLHSIMSGIDPYLDYEAWMLVKRMPNWVPAKMDGQPIDSYVKLPFRFNGLPTY
jgi:hypothetical protein